VKRIIREAIYEQSNEEKENGLEAYSKLFFISPDIKIFVDQLSRLPPQTSKVLIESHSSNSKKGKFYTDSDDYLKLGIQLLKDSKEVTFFNTVPPYEWDHPSPLKSNKLKTVIKNYGDEIKDFKNKIKRKKIIVRRITIINSLDELTSVICNCWVKCSYFPENEIYKFYDWLSEFLNSYKSCLEEKDKAIVDIVVSTISEINQSSNEPKANRGALYRDSEELKKHFINNQRPLEQPPINNQEEPIVQSPPPQIPFPSPLSDDMSRISKYISQKIINDFLCLHSDGEFDAVYLLKNEYIDNFSSILDEEEAVFTLENSEQYIIRADIISDNAFLSTIKQLEKDETHYKNLIKDFKPGHGISATKGGRFIDLMRQLK
jgi:hypothetical protein